MMLNVTRIDTWKALVDDRPGAVASLLEGLAMAGADSELVIARRISSQPGHGFLYVTPLAGDSQIAAAVKLGFQRSPTHFAVRLDGPDEPGAAFLMTRALAAEGINLRGFTAATQGTRFVAYIALDTAADAERAVARLNRPL